MTLALIPQPKKTTTTKQSFIRPAKAVIGIADHSLVGVAEDIGSAFGDAQINISVAGIADTLTIRFDDRLRDGGYRLAIGSKGIVLTAKDVVAAFNGSQTLRQIIMQCGRTLPGLTITDWPDFVERGVYYDVCRGRVPLLEELLVLADGLADYKINHLQLYIEHTFAFRGHPSIGKGASPLSADDILELDDFCRERHIELVPSLASFGHMATVLKHKEYHHLAEDLGVGQYVAPDADKHRRIKGWTLSPANPDIYPFLDSLFAEFLPLFSSGQFNICCDETWDLGLGQTYELCQKKGKGRVYLDHIVKLNKMVRKYGKKTMFWGDIIRHYPDLVAEVPRNVTVLDWGYSSRDNFSRVKDFKDVGLPFFVCPGTRSWVSLFPQLQESGANIHGYAAAGKKFGARGLLNTDWGDGGHYNFMEFSWYGYLYGAEQAWNVGADRDSFTERFSRLFMGSGAADLVAAIDRLGDLSHLNYPDYYESVWQHIFFAGAGDAVLNKPSPAKCWVTRKGKSAWAQVRLNAALGRQTVKRAEAVSKTFAKHVKKKDADPNEVLAYWIFAADTIAHAGRKLAVLGPGGADTAANRRALKREMSGLMKRFEKLWMARNRRSEIRTTLARYRKAIASL